MTTEWQPIDTAPKDGSDMLLWDPVDGMNVGYWSRSIWANGGAWIVYENRSDTVKLVPSHWQPLPEPPTEAGV